MLRGRVFKAFWERKQFCAPGSVERALGSFQRSGAGAGTGCAQGREPPGLPRGGMTAAGRARAEPTRPYGTWQDSVRTVPSLSGPSRCRSAPPVSRPPPRLAVPARGGAGRQLRIAARAVPERVLPPELPRTDPPDPSRPRSVRPWATQSPSLAAPPPPVSALRWAPLGSRGSPSAPGAPPALPQS